MFLQRIRIMESLRSTWLFRLHINIQHSSQLELTFPHSSRSEEMKPEWFSYDSIPYDTMWPDDRYWIPIMLAGKHFIGRFDITQVCSFLTV